MVKKQHNYQEIGDRRRKERNQNDTTTKTVHCLKIKILRLKVTKFFIFPCTQQLFKYNFVNLLQLRQREVFSDCLKFDLSSGDFLFQ